MSSPGDTPPLRVLFNVPVLRALPTIRGDGVAVDFEGFSFFVYLSGEEETATRFTLTPEVPGALELVVTRCPGGAQIIVMPCIATAVLAAVGAGMMCATPDSRKTTARLGALASTPLGTETSAHNSSQPGGLYLRACSASGFWRCGTGNRPLPTTLPAKMPLATNNL